MSADRLHLWNPSLERVLLQACSFRRSVAVFYEQAGTFAILVPIAIATFRGRSWKMMIIANSAVLADAPIISPPAAAYPQQTTFAGTLRAEGIRCDSARKLAQQVIWR